MKKSDIFLYILILYNNQILSNIITTKKMFLKNIVYVSLKFFLECVDSILSKK